MIKLIIKYFQHPWQDRILLFHTVILLGLIRLIILVVPFRYVAAYLGKFMEESPYSDTRESDFTQRVGWAITVMSCYTPWESKCLVQAITGKLLLRRMRLRNTLYLGVAKGQENKMIAHAWLRCGKEVVIGKYVGKEYTVVAKFADFGRVAE